MPESLESSLDIQEYGITSLEELETFRKQDLSPVYTKLAESMGLYSQWFDDHLRKFGYQIMVPDQTGCLLDGDSRNRFHQVKAIQRDSRFGGFLSGGMYTLSQDGYNPSGGKGEYSKFKFLKGSSIHFMTNKMGERNKDVLMNRLELTEDLKTRCTEIFSTVKTIIEIAKDSSNAYQFLKSLRNKQKDLSKTVSIKIDSFLPNLTHPSINKTTEGLYDYLINTLDIPSVESFLKNCEHAVLEEKTWGDLWNRINQYFFGDPVRSLDTVMNDFTFSVKDYKQLAHKYRELAQLDSTPFRFWGVVDENNKHRIVNFDPVTEEMFYIQGGKSYYITWEEIVSLAQKNNTCGPTAPIEYLMLAFSGYFQVPDFYFHPKVDKYQKTAIDIHKKVCGAMYPWLLLKEEELPPTQPSFLEAFSKENLKKICNIIRF